MVAGFQKHKAGAVYIGEQLREILEVPGVKQLFALSPRREGKAEPSLTGGGLPQMVIMEGLYPKRAVGQNTIGDQVRLYVEDRFKIALSPAQQFHNALEYVHIRKEDTYCSAPEPVLIFRVHPAELPDVPKQVGQAANMIHMGV